MPNRTVFPLLAAAAAALALAVAGCGGSGTSTTPPPVPKASAPVSEFPDSADKSMQELSAKYPEGPILAPSVSVLQPGNQRFAFALFDNARKFVNGAGVVLYVSQPDGSHATGPFPARIESLAVRPAFESQTNAQDPTAAKQVYVATVPFPTKGKYAVTAFAHVGGKDVRSSPYGVAVGGSLANQPPAVGAKAIKIHTPTLTSAGGDASSIDTRVPPAKDLLTTDLYDVLGKKPVVLMFATPQLCASRVCGPVVDVEEQVANQTGGKVAFIHNEIYKDNTISKGLRPEPAAYRLPSEPWTFVIDRHGVIRTRFEGAFSPGELERAVAQVEAKN